MTTITLQDVAAAAADKNIGLLQALNMMQGVCAKAGDEETLSQLCAIKSELLFGDE